MSKTDLRELFLIIFIAKLGLINRPYDIDCLMEGESLKFDYLFLSSIYSPLEIGREGLS